MQLINEKHNTLNSMSNRKLIYGVGINDAPYVTQPKVKGKRVCCPYYATWKEMIKRCYSRVYHKKQPTYVNCKVCDDWKRFTLFKSWMVAQDWKGNHLDKDVIKPNNLIYSPEFCRFIPQSLNNLLTDHRNKRGKYPQGVSKERCGRFKASISKSCKRINLGRYDTPEKASEVYKKAKYNHIISVANVINNDTDLRFGLIEHARLILNGD